MSRMYSRLLTLLIVFSLIRSASSAAPDEISEMLLRAEALYYEADFAKSVELLLRADEMLREQPGHEEQKTSVKLQLALGFIGLNDNARAKTYLGELYALNPDHRLDPQVFSPKVLRLAEEAKTDYRQQRCRSLAGEVETHLQAGDADAVVKLMEPNRTQCSDLAPLYSKAATRIYHDGVEAYKKAQMPEALQ